MKSYFKRISVCVCTVILLLSLQIPHAFADDADYLARLHGETGSDVLSSKYGDFDGDSSFEMVALTDSGNKDDGYDGDVYFLTKDRIDKIVSNAHFWGTDAVEVFEICGVNFIAVKTVPGNYADTKVFTVVNGECVLTNISEISHNLKTKFDDNTLAVLDTNFDGMFDGRGFLSRTEKDYFFYWDSEAVEFKEYGGIKITPEQLATLDGASEILELIKNAGRKLGDIFFRKNGIINCNYTYTEEGDTSGVYYCGNANMMYDGVSCKLLEVNDWDDTALQRSSYGGIYEAALSNNAVYPDAFTEEELAEIEAQKEQEEQQRLARQRKREKAYREKRKAQKIAENGGEIVKTKVCPHCNKEFIPTSNRQVFCSKECCYQARQDGKKAEREAERGNHYYRQRECAVCGNSYWPTHSQQKYCSEECQKESHNKKSLEFYHQKREKEKLQCKDISQTKERVSDMNLSENITIPA